MHKTTTIEVNGIEIPNTCTCMWCGSQMRRKGAFRAGENLSQFALWCDNCGAVVFHAKDDLRKIKSLTVKYQYEEGI